MFVLTGPQELGDFALAPLEERHAGEVFALTDANREHLGRYLPWVEGTREVADSLAFIRSARRQAAAGEAVHVGIFAAGRLVGHASLMDIAPGHMAEIGYWLAAEAQGRGLMTRTVSALVEHAFDELGLRRLLIRARPDNRRSIAVAERLGFAFEGVARGEEVAGGQLHDMAHYGLVR
jgi:ribosomal-protein-serine acetyltransferase